MSLRFIIGRAGSGKTHFISESIKQTVSESPDGSPVIFLVPEQATFQMELDMARVLGGAVRALVLSFRRLAHRVFLETGGAARIPIGELGKRMFLRELLERNKENLRVLGKSAGRIGFADSLARAIGEFKTYLITPENLETAGRVIENADLLRDKLSDLSLLYGQLEDYLSIRYTDPDDYLNMLAEKLSYASSFTNAEVWIDGFKGFTPQEIKVIEKLLQSAKRVNVALCMDPAVTEAGLQDDNVFYPVWETYKRVSEAAAKTGVLTEETVVLADAAAARFAKAPDIAWLEKHFFTYPASPFEGDKNNIKIVAASNRRAEVEACAREMIRLVRDEGYRWRDMAVLLRDMEPYHELIKAVFQDHEIPVFIDRKRNVLHHPLVELIRSVLEIAEKDWVYQPVFRYLKTDIVPVAREQVYLLENYVLAHGIRGDKWTSDEDWQYVRRYTLGEDTEASERDRQILAEINEARRNASAAAISFTAKTREYRTVKEITNALYDLLEELNAAETIDRWRIEAEEAGFPDKAREHRQIWSNVINLLDEMVEALGDDELTIETYREVLDAGFQSMTLSLIPPVLDQVVIASLDRSRSPRIRTAFILGVSEGVFPARTVGEGIFSETEREKLERIGLCLAPGGRRRAFEEQYLVYTALTRASEKLWISFPMADDEGRANSPSSIISRTRELIPGLEVKSLSAEPLTDDCDAFAEFMVHPGRALSYLICRLRNAQSGEDIGEVWWNLYNWFIDHYLQEDKTVSLFKSIFHTNREEHIGREKSLALYGSPVKASVSRLEKFRACPFAHFSSYGLKLSERKIYRLEAPDMGEFFHAALKCFADRLEQESLDWGSLSTEECLKISNEIIDGLAPQLQNEILLSTARYRYLTGKLKKTINRAVITLAEHARRGAFRPKSVELSFGPGGLIPPMVIQLPGGIQMQLSGRIDRLDAAEKDGAVYLRVIDYKSSHQGIVLPEIYHGLKLQLLTYLHVALQHYSRMGLKVKPAGILYYTVREPLIPVQGPLPEAEAARLILSNLKMRGFFLDDREVFRMMDNQTESGWSELFPVGIKRDGSFYSSSPVFNESQFSLLTDYLNRVFMEAGEEIVAGNVTIEPYRDNAITACTFCEYKPVCKFDNQLSGNNYRSLPKVSEDDIWKLITDDGGETDDRA